jgi:hypothetical protein
MIELQVLIETHLNIEGTRNMRSGYFYVNDDEFKEDEDFTVACVAYEWIQKQKREFGCNDIVVDKVIWNKENDITEIVRQIVPVLPPDDLPF